MSNVTVIPGGSEVLVQVSVVLAAAVNAERPPPVLEIGVPVALEHATWRLADAETAVRPHASTTGRGLDSVSVKSPPPLVCPVICHTTVPH